VVILVKRAPGVWWREAKETGAPLIWDVLDFWRQPDANNRTEAEFVREVIQMRDAVHISRLIGATQAMADAIGGVYIPHHHRLGLTAMPIRKRARVVAYEGSARYLGSWRVALERACARLGLTFLVNPPDLSEADLVVAFRDELWDGWACRQWKSGIKYVNAIVAGRPVLTQECAAFREIAPTGAVVEDHAALDEAIAKMTADDVRQKAWLQGRKRVSEFSIDRIARQYRDLVQSVVRTAV
jgi:hypothetical protein